MSLGRASYGFGGAPTTYRDIAAWSELTGHRPSPDEVRLILLMDRAYLAESHRLNTPPKTK